MGTYHRGWQKEEVAASRRLFPSRRVALTTIGERRASDARRSPHGASVFVLKLPANEYQRDWRAGYGRMGSVILAEGGEHGVFHKLGGLRSWRGLWGRGGACFSTQRLNMFLVLRLIAIRTLIPLGYLIESAKRDGSNGVALILRSLKSRNPFVRLTTFGECCY